MAAMSVTGSAPSLMAANCAYTGAVVVASLVNRTQRQRIVPRAMLGRVTSGVRVLFLTVDPIGVVLAGTAVAARVHEPAHGSGGQPPPPARKSTTRGLSELSRPPAAAIPAEAAPKQDTGVHREHPPGDLLRRPVVEETAGRHHLHAVGQAAEGVGSGGLPQMGGRPGQRYPRAHGDRPGERGDGEPVLGQAPAGQRPGEHAGGPGRDQHGVPGGARRWPAGRTRQAPRAVRRSVVVAAVSPGACTPRWHRHPGALVTRWTGSPVTAVGKPM
jgi:hypothetical protein